MQTYEKLGVFYLGKEFNPTKKEVSKNFLLYDSKDLTTHAVCVGMTGSGKTGLGIALIEEAALDKIPALLIDPKGDLSNLLLTFPQLSASEFLPWIDGAEAERKGMTPEAYAESVAKTWKDGLAKWDEKPERIQKLKDSVDMAIYTPASQAGIPLSILSSFAAPSKEFILDTAAMRDRVMSVTSSLLGLLGIQADPIKSREHILISNILDDAWRKGTNLDIAMLIQQIQKPPFDKIGALDIDTFFSPKERMALSINLNNLLASPGFQAWLEGEPLDIQQLLYTKEGKPKVSILSIAHLSDSERMFFVTLLLNELLAWMRRQPGTSSLRALFYMDEIFGYFPPNAMPPSKTPMLTLLKQARAFGLGIVLATQNPVDLDYKGLSNCGTWFIGKLQTARDKARVLEGLQIASNGEIDSKSLDRMIASTGNRVFIMRSIHEKDPVLFETRWTLSYLRGPLTLAQITQLTDKTAVREARPEPAIPTATQGQTQATQQKPLLPPSIQEFFVRRPQMQDNPTYRPLLMGLAKLHFVDAKAKIDTWEDVCLVAAPIEEGKNVHWEEAENLPDVKQQLEKDPVPDSAFEPLPAGLMQEKNYPIFEKSLATSLYQNQTLNNYRYPPLNLTSKEGETEEQFRARTALMLREKRDEMVQKLRDKYGPKIATLTDRLRRAQDKMSEQHYGTILKKAEAYISMGATVLGAILGKKVTKGTISDTETSIRRIGRASRDTQSTATAEEDYKSLQQELDALQTQMNDEIAQATANVDPSKLVFESTVVRPRKNDISISKIALIWWPLPPKG